MGDSVPVPLALDALPSLGGSLEFSSPTSVPMSDPCLDQFRRPSPIQSVQDVGPLVMHVPQLVKFGRASILICLYYTAIMPWWL